MIWNVQKVTGAKKGNFAISAARKLSCRVVKYSQYLKSATTGNAPTVAFISRTSVPTAQTAAGGTFQIFDNRKKPAFVKTMQVFLFLNFLKEKPLWRDEALKISWKINLAEFSFTELNSELLIV